MKGWGVEGGTESGGARVSSPFGGSRAPTLPLKGTKPNSIVFIKGLYPQAGEDPRGEGRGWGMGWGAGGVARAVGGDGGKVAIAPRLPPPPRRTHSFPWDEHRKG